MLYASPSNAGHTWRLFPSLTRLDDLGEFVVKACISEAFAIRITLLRTSPVHVLRHL